MYRLVIRCDAAALPEIGTGHVFRQCGIASALVVRGIVKRDEIVFITRQDKDYELGAKIITAHNFKMLTVLDPLEWNSPQEIAIICRTPCEWVIVDRLSTSKDFMRSLKNTGRGVIAFDDVGEGGELADLVINGILEKRTHSTHYMQGYQYLSLNGPGFEVMSDGNEPVKTVFACFGGYDHNDIWSAFFSILLRFSNERLQKSLEKLTVYVAAPWNSPPVATKIKDFLWGDGIELVFLNKEDDFYGSLSRSSMSLVSGGLIFFESLQAGVPTLAVAQYEHQVESIIRIEKLGGCRIGYPGVKVDIDLMFENFCLLYDLSDERKRIALRGSELIDGGGRNRVVDILIDKLNTHMR